MHTLQAVSFYAFYWNNANPLASLSKTAVAAGFTAASVTGRLRGKDTLHVLVLSASTKPSDLTKVFA